MEQVNETGGIDGLMKKYREFAVIRAQPESFNYQDANDGTSAGSRLNGQLERETAKHHSYRRATIGST
jgi:hypothetical protein